MRSLWKISLAAAFLAFAAACGTDGATEDTKNLELNAAGIKQLHIENKDGAIHVTGDPSLQTIEVTAQIRYKGISGDKLVLSLDKSGSTATMKGYFKEQFSVGLTYYSVDLDIRVPESLSLRIDDEDGEITVENIKGDILVDDGDGELTLKDITGNITVKDGDGAMILKNITGDIAIEDGDGSIELSHTSGEVTLKDGDGGIKASDHNGPFTITYDGDGDIELTGITGNVFVKDEDGGIRLSDIGGSVEVSDGDGDIRIDGVEKDVLIRAAGDGGLKIDNVKGKVTKP
jgi:DUF4097 and DUF4098 domain-containing protein YvlB